jgi:peptidyl-prolyl cis-trans isomerase C
MTMKRALLGLLALAVGAVCGCQKQSASSKSASGASKEIVAEVGDLQISLQEFEDQLKQQNPLLRTSFNTLEQKKKLLDTLIEREAMALEAKRLGLDKDPEMIRGFEKILARQLINQEFNQKVSKEINITDAEIEAYYKENQDRYHAQEKVLVHSIFLPAPSDKATERKKAKTTADEILKQLKSNSQDRRLFYEMMQKYPTEEGSRPMEGTSTFKTHQELEQSHGKTFADAAFSMQQANDISGVVEQEKGFFILRQAGKQAAVDLPLEKVSSQIRSTLFSKARSDAYQKFIENIKTKVKVRVFDDVLANANPGPAEPEGSMGAPRAGIPLPAGRMPPQNIGLPAPAMGTQPNPIQLQPQDAREKKPLP